MLSWSKLPVLTAFGLLAWIIIVSIDLYEVFVKKKEWEPSMTLHLVLLVIYIFMSWVYLRIGYISTRLDNLV